MALIFGGRLSLRRRLGVPILIGVVSLALLAPAAPALGAPVLPSAPQSAVTSATAPAFATRAGYSATWVSAATSVGAASGTTDIVVTFAPTNDSLFDPLPAGAPAMSEAEIADQYGLSPAAYGAAAQYFEARGLTVTHDWPDRLSLSLAGPAADVGAAFGTTLEAGQYEGRAVTFPSSPPTLPASLEGEISSVVGLSNGFDTFTLPALGPVSALGASSTPAQVTDNLVTPSIARDIYDISGLYNLTSGPTYASGRGIVLLLWGWGYAPSDLSTFFSEYYPSAFPQPTITAYPVDGAPSPAPSAVNDPSNGSRELTLDLEWSGSMAPGATLDAVYAPPGPSSDGYSPTGASMVDALNTAVTPSDVPGVVALSMSFGSTDGGDPSLQASFESDFAVAGKEKISLFGATGDTGGDAGAGCTGGVAPEYPSTSTYVLAVGGTSVTLDRGPLGGVTGYSETAWSDSGGGFSTDYKAPSWQLVGSAAAPISAAGGYRGVPDVAATAADNFLYFDGETYVGGGTSFATPLWAGMVTEMDALNSGQGRSAFGFFTPALYALAAGPAGPSALHDITSGSNCVGSAGVGWDVVTGWGSPDGVLLYEHLISTFVNVTISASPSPVAPGGTVTVAGVVTNSTTGAPMSGLSVVVTLVSSGLGGPCSGTFGTTTLTTNSSGGVSASIGIPACYLGARASASVTVTGNGYYGQASGSVAVNLLGWVPSLAGLATFPANLVLFFAIIAVAVVIGGLLGRAPPSSPRRASPRYPAAEPATPSSAAPPDPPPPPVAGTAAADPSASVPPSGPPPPGLFG